MVSKVSRSSLAYELLSKARLTLGVTTMKPIAILLLIFVTLSKAQAGDAPALGAVDRIGVALEFIGQPVPESALLESLKEKSKRIVLQNTLLEKLKESTDKSNEHAIFDALILLQDGNLSESVASLRQNFSSSKWLRWIGGESKTPLEKRFDSYLETQDFKIRFNDASDCAKEIRLDINGSFATLPVYSQEVGNCYAYSAAQMYDDFRWRRKKPSLQQGPTSPAAASMVYAFRQDNHLAGGDPSVAFVDLQIAGPCHFQSEYFVEMPIAEIQTANWYADALDWLLHEIKVKVAIAPNINLEAVQSALLTISAKIKQNQADQAKWNFAIIVLAQLTKTPENKSIENLASGYLALRPYISSTGISNLLALASLGKNDIANAIARINLCTEKKQTLLEEIHALFERKLKLSGSSEYFGSEIVTAIPLFDSESRTQKFDDILRDISSKNADISNILGVSKASVGIDYCVIQMVRLSARMGFEETQALDRYSRVRSVSQCGLHASVIIGQRYSSETKRCEFLVRNSWGTRWRYTFESNRFNDIWFPANYLSANTIKAWASSDILSSPR